MLYIHACRLKEALRGIAERESDLKRAYHEQKLALKAYQNESEYAIPPAHD